MWAKAEPGTNYKSFEEAGQDAEAELRRLRQAKYTTTVGSWKDVVKRFGQCIVSRLACIVELMRDGTKKIRMLIDFRRSGVNQFVKANERIVLPRVIDVLSDCM